MPETTPLTPPLAQRIADVQAGRSSARTEVEQCLAAIERWEPHVQAWVLVDAAGALRQARDIDRRRARGQPLGALSGAVVGVKDIVDVAGWPTLCGSVNRQGTTASADAPLVARLRAADAIVLGKTVTAQWACFDPPDTRNPWCLSHTPGGSSSGSAAAVATGMCHFALATQTGGSITRPASYCGVAGLKPSFHGGWSLAGVQAVSPRLDHLGVVAPTAADLAAIWRTVGPGQRGGAARARAPRRIGLLTDFLEHAEPALAAAVEQFAKALRRAGVETPRVRLPVALEEIWRHHQHLMAFDAAFTHWGDFHTRPAGYGPNVSSLIRRGLELRGEELCAAAYHQQATVDRLERFAAEFDALLTPATPAAAPASRATTGDPRMNSPWSYSGLPTVSAPLGLAPDGLPWGFQLAGRERSEAKLLAIAQWCGRRVEPLGQPPCPPV